MNEPDRKNAERRKNSIIVTTADIKKTMILSGLYIFKYLIKDFSQIALVFSQKNIEMKYIL